MDLEKETEPGATYVVVTTDGIKHRLREWRVNDEYIVVYDVYDDPRNPRQEKPELPYNIPWADVEQMEYSRLSFARTFAAVVVVTAIAAALYVAKNLRFD